MKGFDLKSILKTGVSFGSVLTGGKAKSILDIVNSNILDDTDPHNEGALKELAEQYEAAKEVLINHEQRLRAIEKKLGL